MDHEKVTADLVAPLHDAEQTYAIVQGQHQIQHLRENHRLCGTPDGIGVGESQALRLSLEEVAVAVAHDCVTLAPVETGLAAAEAVRAVEKELKSIIHGDECGGLDEGGREQAWTLTRRRRHRIQVYHHLWQLGYYVTFGSKFGADFLIYREDPARAHSLALIIVKDFEEPFARVDVVSFGRVAKMVKKELYFASVRPPAEANRERQDRVVFVSLTHGLLTSRQDEDDTTE